ncbi:hypothetical protein H6775_03715 [Candidatus Nomurabacteria bacterium]|nr:hypothetical protein [Candidatus Nomurabacteria bacterium]
MSNIYVIFSSGRLYPSTFEIFKVFEDEKEYEEFMKPLRSILTQAEDTKFESMPYLHEHLRFEPHAQLELEAKNPELFNELKSLREVVKVFCFPLKGNKKHSFLPPSKPIKQLPSPLIYGNAK